MFDVTNADSFNNLARWRAEFMEKAHIEYDTYAVSFPSYSILFSNPENFPVIVLANKVDTIGAGRERAISISKANAWCKSIGAFYYETR